MMEPSENIRIGRRGLEEVSGLSILDDLQWDQVSKRFFIRVSINIEIASSLVPAQSEWYITIAPEYPYGEIGVHPSARHSINCTFPHQSNNFRIAENGLWREGKICVTFDSMALGIHAHDREPASVEDRLSWYGERAVLWVRNAAEDTLVSTGDLFELPDFSPKVLEIFAFNEDTVSFMQWEECTNQAGFATIRIKDNPGAAPVLFVTSFLTEDKETVYQPCWSNVSFVNENSSDEECAIWIKLDRPPCVRHSQAPVTFSELQEACLTQGVHFYKTIKQFAPKLRDGAPHLILFGFPVSQRIGDPPDEIAWQAMRLPTLSFQKKVNPKFQSGKKNKLSGWELGATCGFRPGETGWWQNDMQSILSPGKELEWIKSENWSNHCILSRGQYAQDLCRKKVAVVGSGSLGSALSELLVRGGVRQLCCIDGDVVLQGNLCRHSLSMQELGQIKSVALAKRLSSINPHTIISSNDDYLRLNSDCSLSPDLSPFDIVIDTTGSDQVIELLAQTADKKRLILSASVGLGAKRLYICMFKKANPAIAHFLKMLSPFFSKDQEECGLAMSELPREGIGCWHPLFPATASDMWMAAGVTQKALEQFVIQQEHNSLIAVYESKTCDGLFTGFNPVEVEYDSL